MSIHINLSRPHGIVAANSHYYKTPTEVLYIDRVLPCHDLIYLVDGNWLITENGTDYPLNKDDVLLLAAGRHHYTRLPCKPETRTICIHVTREQGDDDDSEHSLELPSLMHMKGAPKVKQYFQEIVDAHWFEDARKQARMSALFTLLMLELHDKNQESTALKTNISAEAIRIINMTPYRHFAVGEVAEMLYVSAKTLENAMHKSVGMSFSAFQMQRKLEMVAQQLGVEPDVRLKEIAQAFGFCDEFHMSKAFKKLYGVSPSTYRRKISAEHGGAD